MVSSVTAADFEGYIRFRALDAIAYPGSYKKFLLARKEQEAAWAVAMTAQIQAVNEALQELDGREQELRGSPLQPMQTLIQHVSESNLPPSDLQLTIATCLISRKTGIPCVVIRGKGRGSLPFTVASRFVPFLYDLWTVHKLDVLIKTFARQCIELADPDGHMPMAEIAALFQGPRADDVRALAAAFHAAFEHVLRSIVAALQTSI